MSFAFLILASAPTGRLSHRKSSLALTPEEEPSFEIVNVSSTNILFFECRRGIKHFHYVHKHEYALWEPTSTDMNRLKEKEFLPFPTDLIFIVMTSTRSWIKNIHDLREWRELTKLNKTNKWVLDISHRPCQIVLSTLVFNKLSDILKNHPVTVHPNLSQVLISHEKQTVRDYKLHSNTCDMIVKILSVWHVGTLICFIYSLFEQNSHSRRQYLINKHLIKTIRDVDTNIRSERIAMIRAPLTCTLSEIHSHYQIFET